MPVVTDTDFAGIAKTFRVPEPLLRSVVGLHLPRLAPSDDPAVLTRELANGLQSALSGSESRTRRPERPLDLNELVFRRIDETPARALLERLKYVLSFRTDSKHYGLVSPQWDGERIVALATVSACDLDHVLRALPTPIQPDRARVVSRVFAFDWAPRNSISFLLSRVVRALEQGTEPPDLLLTYVNPNLGFTGASYRASNWILVCHEAGTHYHYLDGRYVTDRELVRQFGTTDLEQLRSTLGPRVERSRNELQPLEVYAYPLPPRLRRLLQTHRPVDVHVREWQPNGSTRCQPMPPVSAIGDT